MGRFKFNKTNYLPYVQSVEDFTIGMKLYIAFDERTSPPVLYKERENIKTLLTEFLIECEYESQKSSYEFLDWLDERKRHWQVIQYNVIVELNEIIKNQKRKQKSESESEKSNYIDFFTHQRKLIAIIRNELLNDFQNIEALPNTKTKPTYLQYALYYYYLQHAGINEPFENFSGGKVKAIENIVKEAGLPSAKRFQQDYNSISVKLSERQSRCKKRDYEVLLRLLTNYPAAQELVKKELKKTDW
jgi:hypothetical protein